MTPATLCLAAALAASAAPALHAQTPPPAPAPAASAPSTVPAPAETIVVIGTKRSLAQQQTTQSVSVLTEALQPGMQSAFDALHLIPNVIQFSDSFLPTVRGLDGNGTAQGGGGAVSGSSPRMANYIDGVARTFGAAPDGQGSFWDIAQVEVYRGSQSTLFGQNSLAGVIVQTTRDPVFRDEFAVQVGLRTKQTTWNAAVMANKAINDVLALRVTAEQQDGKTPIDYSNFTDPGLDESDRDDLGRVRYARYRLKALIVPTDKLSFKVTAENERRRNAYPPDIGTGERGVRKGRPVTNGSFDSETRVFAVNANYEIARAWSFDAVLSQQNAKTRFGPPVVGNPDVANYLDFTFASTETAFEPKFVYRAPQGRSSAVIGAHVKERDRSDLGKPGTAFQLDADDRVTSRSVFADATLQVAPRWDVLAGGRYIDDRQKRDFSAFDGFLAFGFDERGRVFLPKLGATFHATDDASFSVVAYEGYNAGGGGVSFVTFTPYRFKKETARTLELVSRTQWLDRKLTLNANLFATQLKDTQVGGIGPAGPTDGIYLNIADARTRGLEVDAVYRPNAQARVGVGLGLLDTKIVDFGSEANNFRNGNRLGLAPRVSANVNASFEVLPNLTVGGDVAYVGARFSDYENTPENRLGSYVQANLHARYRVGKVSVNAYINNVFDRFVQYQRFAEFDEAYFNDPRTFGVNVRVDF
jgi:outer membrane receptor protein involved in Fe transport